MSTMSTIIFFVLLSIAAGSMSYKIYLQTGLKNPGKGGYDLYKKFAFQLNIITYFLPMSVKYKDAAETIRRKRANKALAVFYICFVCILFLSLVMN